MASPSYDHVVVGSGISGMTAALLLSKFGGRVLLLEKAPAIGGSMVRFPLQGIPFDTGFHFTGGLAPGDLLHDMLKVLGIDKDIKPVAFSRDDANRFVFESSGCTHAYPCDRAGIKQVLYDEFPADCGAVDRYFELIDEVCANTASMDVRKIGENMHMLDEDFKSLTDVLDELTGNSELKAILGSYCLCYGVAPSEISFANHARICQGLHDGIVRVEEGGEAFVSALKRELETAGVEIMCRRQITGCEELEGSNVGAFRLDSGELIRFSNALFTIHPQSVLELLPKDSLRKAFINRVSGYEQSFGFFAVFGVCEDPDLLEDCAMTIFPDAELDSLLKPGRRDDDSMLFCITGRENDKNGKPCQTVTALEVAHPEDVEEWADSSLMKRAAAYDAYKAEKTDRIVERILAQFPELKGRFKVLGSSSTLTFRDYLHSPDGSAYGVKQKMGQFNLIGRMPLRNLYAAGQSSVLPGMMGAMVSSFIVCRSMLDRAEFDQFVNQRLDV